LVTEGKEEEARRKWESTLRLLERWKERGVGGTDVLNCIEDGNASLRGEPPNEKSWVRVKRSRESTS
jgi:vacuolar protein sorting-associated protein 51